VNSDEVAMIRAASEHAGHLALYTTRHDGKGRVKWKDEGGLACSCGWSAPREGLYRPWSAWHMHVTEAVLAAYESAPATGKHVEPEPDPTESSFSAAARKRLYRAKNEISDRFEPR